MHSSGQLSTLINFLEGYHPENEMPITKMFKTNNFKYYLINEMAPTRKPVYIEHFGKVIKEEKGNDFINMMGKSVNNYMTQFATGTGIKEAEKENAFFLVINQHYIPTTLIQLYDYIESESNTSVGFFIAQANEKKYTEVIKTEGKNYSENFLRNNEKRGINYLSGINFTIELTKQRRNKILRAISGQFNLNKLTLFTVV